MNEPRGDGMGEGGVARGGILKLRNDQYIINSLIRVDFRYFICLFFIPLALTAVKPSQVFLSKYQNQIGFKEDIAFLKKQ